MSGPVRKLPPKDPLERWNLLGVAQLSEALPPIPWVCESLGLAPGAVSLFAGYGYSGKTMALQSLGLSVAAGKSVWGVWRARQGRFVHLDYEQGRRLTQERYQRLARGMGFELAELEPDCMRVGVMPRAYLDEEGAIEDLVRIVDGATFVLVDSLRAAFPRADENSSEVRTYLDVLTRVSERTQACISVIHHARKPSPQNGGTATHSIRGSGALFDACQSVYVLAGEKNQPTTIHHEKDRVRGVTLEDFGLSREDVPGESGTKHGLRVVHLETQQLADVASSREDAREDAAVVASASRILSTVGPDGFQGSRTDLKAMVKGRTETFDTALVKLINTGWIVRSGGHHSPFWCLGNGEPSPHPPSVPKRPQGSHNNPSPIPPPLREGMDGLNDRPDQPSPKLLDSKNLFRKPDSESNE